MTTILQRYGVTVADLYLALIREARFAGRVDGGDVADWLETRRDRWLAAIAVNEYGGLGPQLSHIYNGANQVDTLYLLTTGDRTAELINAARYQWAAVQVGALVDRAALRFLRHTDVKDAAVVRITWAAGDRPSKGGGNGTR